VHLSYRGSDLTRVKERNRLKFEAAVAAGKLSVVFGSQVREIREADVVLAVGEQTIHLPNDYVIIRVGGDPPLKFLERIGVRVVRKDVPLMSA
jgi:thioredoxin reductase